MYDDIGVDCGYNAWFRWHRQSGMTLRTRNWHLDQLVRHGVKQVHLTVTYRPKTFLATWRSHLPDKAFSMYVIVCFILNWCQTLLSFFT